MPKVLLKDATATWKKAKPVLLTKTGVSEELRKLEKFGKLDENMSKWIPILEGTRKVLEVAIANKHIAKEKKALECLNAILLEVKDQIKHIPALKTTINNSLKNAHLAATKALAAPTEQSLSTFESVMKSYLAVVGKENGFYPTTGGFTGYPQKLSGLVNAFVQYSGKGDKQAAQFKTALEQLLKVAPPTVA